MKIFYRFCSLAFCLFFCSSALAKVLTLKDCYQLALQRSEAVKYSEEDIRLIRAKYQEVLGAVMPRLTVTATETLQERISTTDGFSTTFNRFSTPSVAVTLTQPIFHGFKDFYALRAGKAEWLQKEFLVREAKRGLYTDVATTYYTIMSLDRHIRTTNQILSVLRSQMAEMNKWFALGKIRESEVAAHKTEMALLEAGLEKDQGDKLMAYDVLAYFTGLDPHPAIVSQNPFVRQLPSLDYFLQAALNRPDVSAIKQSIHLSDEGVKMAKSDFMPAIDFTADYYPYRVGVSANVDWDVQFKMQVPVFNLSNIGKLKEAKSTAIQTRLLAEQKEKVVKTDVKKAFTSLQSSLRQLSRYQQAVSLAQKSYHLQRDDYLNGLVSHLDVLQSERSWFEALKQRDAAEIQAWMDWITLQSNAGTLP
jgi:outer membrane protein TolC